MEESTKSEIRMEESSKSEIRNPKQIRMTKIPMFKTSNPSRGFGHPDFEFVSDFVLRTSDFASGTKS